MGHELELPGHLKLRVERTQVVAVRGKGDRRKAEAMPLDMISGVSFGFTLGNIALPILGGLALLASLAPSLLSWRLTYVAAALLLGLVIAGLSVLMFLQQTGRFLQIDVGGTHHRYAIEKDGLPAAQRFARALLDARVAFIEGVYGEEE